MQTIETVIKKINKIAEDNQNNPELRIVEIPFLKEGECYRQGDLYIFKVSDSHPVGAELDRRQLADGESIGQRHVLLGGEFKIYQGIEKPKLPDGFEQIDNARVKAQLGYAFDILELDDCRNGHPEHTHFVFPQKGRYQVWHQLNRQTLDRVRD